MVSDPNLMPLSRRRGPYGALGLTLLAALAFYFPFVRHSPVPLLQWADLGFHESSHWLVRPFNQGVPYFLAGTVGQVLWPLAIGGYLTWRGDGAGACWCLVWAGSAAQAGSVYIADAWDQELQLLGGNIHDWGYILGPQGFDDYAAAPHLAHLVYAGGELLALAGIAGCLAVTLWRFRREHKLRAE